MEGHTLPYALWIEAQYTLVSQWFIQCLLLGFHLRIKIYELLLSLIYNAYCVGDNRRQINFIEPKFHLYLFIVDCSTCMLHKRSLTTRLTYYWSTHGNKCNGKVGLGSCKVHSKELFRMVSPIPFKRSWPFLRMSIVL